MSTIHLISATRAPSPTNSPTRRWSIQPPARQSDRTIGRVASCAPIADGVYQLLPAALIERHAGILDGPALAAYRDAYVARLAAYDLRPGFLRGYRWYPMREGELIRDGDTLVDVRVGVGVRTWLAAVLVRAGWRVFLDGREFTAPIANDSPAPTGALKE